MRIILAMNVLNKKTIMKLVMTIDKFMYHIAIYRGCYIITYNFLYELQYKILQIKNNEWKNYSQFDNCLQQKLINILLRDIFMLNILKLEKISK
jgi:hypothetical protein